MPSKLISVVFFEKFNNHLMKFNEVYSTCGITLVLPRVNKGYFIIKVILFIYFKVIGVI